MKVSFGQNCNFDVFLEILIGKSLLGSPINIFHMDVYMMKSCIKVALNFMYFKNMQKWIQLTNQFCLLSMDHWVKEKKPVIFPTMPTRFLLLRQIVEGHKCVLNPYMGEFPFAYSLKKWCCMQLKKQWSAFMIIPSNSSK
jgi:hypothetical protein